MLPHEVSAFPAVAAALTDSGEPYCVLHGWQGLESRPATDIDLAVSPGALRVLELALQNKGWQIIQLIPYEIGACFFIASRVCGSRRDFLCIDAIVDFRHQGRVYLGTHELLAGTLRHDVFRVAAPDTQFAYLLVKKIIKGTFPTHQRDLLIRLCSGLGVQGLKIVTRLLGVRWGTRTHEWISRGEWVGLQENLASLRRALRASAARRYPRNRIGYWPAELKRLFGRIRDHTGLTVALLGPDGSGKTTLIESLRSGFAAAFNHSAVFRLRPDIFRRNLPGANPHPHAAPSRSACASTAKLALLLVDYVAGYWITLKPRLVRNDLILFDRYYHDLLADPTRYRLRGLARLARLVGRLIPGPDVFLILEAPETAILARKSELTLDALRRLRVSYRNTASRLRRAYVIDAAGDSAQVARAAEAIVCEYLHRRYLERRHLWLTPRQACVDRSVAAAPSRPILTEERR